MSELSKLAGVDLKLEHGKVTRFGLSDHIKQLIIDAIDSAVDPWAKKHGLVGAVVEDLKTSLEKALVEKVGSA